MNEPLDSDQVERLLRAGESALDKVKPLGNRLGRYELQHVLGRGAMGIVYAALDPELNRTVAVKVLMAPKTQVLLARFRREARIMGGLSHPNLVTLHDFGEQGGWHYLVMERIAGMSLDQWMQSSHEPAEVLALVEKAARGVGAAHLQGVVHRDLKPANVLIDELGEPRVGDFGLAVSPDSDERMTQSGAILGTPLYMAPEQVAGQGATVLPPTDVYALGAILYEGLTGSPPHVGANMGEVCRKILNVDPIPPRRTNPAVSADLEAVCLKALDKDPGRRYATALQFAEDLERVRVGTPVLARPASAFLLLARRFARRPAAWILAVLLAASAIVGGVGILKARAGAARERWASDLSGAYHELSFKTLRAMNRLEDRWFQVGGPDTSGEDCRHVESVVREVSATYPHLRVPSSWLALARFFRDGNSDLSKLEEDCRTPSRDPFPHLFLARAHLMLYVAEAELPFFRTTLLSARPDPFFESPSLARRREAAQAALETAFACDVFGRMNQGRESFVFAEGARHFGRGNRELAIRTLAGIREDPMLGESAMLLSGLAQYLEGRFVEAMAAWDRSAARNWPLSLARAGIARVSLAAAGLKPVESRELLKSAIRDFEAADAHRPGEYRMNLATTRRLLATLMIQAGEPADLILDAALEDCGIAGRLNPVNPRLGLVRGALFRCVGDNEALRGRDPSPAFDKAIAELRAVQPPGLEAMVNLGNVLGRKAILEMSRGRDAKTGFDEAIAVFSRAAADHPEVPEVLFSRGETWSMVARNERLQGRDSARGLEHAIEDFSAVIVMAPRMAAPLAGRAEALANRADLKNDKHRDQEAALEDCRRAVELEPGCGAAWATRAGIHVRRSEADADAGRDPIPEWDHALRDYTEGLAFNPDAAALRAGRGLVRYRRALWRTKDQVDPGDDLQQALGDLDRAVELNAYNAAIRLNRALVHDYLGRLPGARPGPHFDCALADYRDAARLNPRSVKAWAGLGRLLEHLGRTEESMAALRRAVDLDPADSELRELLDGKK